MGQDFAPATVVFPGRRPDYRVHPARPPQSLADRIGNRNSGRPARDGRVRTRAAQDRPTSDALAARRKLEINLALRNQGFGDNRRVPQVSLLRPGIRANNLEWKTHSPVDYPVKPRLLSRSTRQASGAGRPAPPRGSYCDRLPTKPRVT